MLFNMTETAFRPPDPSDVVITSDAWAQIMSHMPQTEERRKRNAEAAKRRELGVAELLATGIPTRRLEFVRRIEPPAPNMDIYSLATTFNGFLMPTWIDHENGRLETIETPTERTATVSDDIMPEPVSYLLPLPGDKWLGVIARSDFIDDDNIGLGGMRLSRTDGSESRLKDGAWVVDASGNILASGNFGDALLRPVVGSNGEIWVTYFDEHPGRSSDGAWSRTENGDYDMIPDSVIPVESVDEYSDYGKYTAGYTGMTVYDVDLKVVGRHEGTDICEVYYSHTDGTRFWYVSYPEWVIDCWGSGGQEFAIWPDGLKGSPIIACDKGLARFSGEGGHRDSLFFHRPDGTLCEEVVVMPDGNQLRQGQIATWGRYLHFLDGLDWYRLAVFQE
jgi:hypothetical protein